MNNHDSWEELLAGSFEQFVSTFGAYLPKLFSALVLLVAGLVIALLSRWLIMRLGQWLERLTQRVGIGAYYFRLRWSVARIIATIVYWLVILFFVTAAAESLGLPGITDWLNRLVDYSPSILVAGLIIWTGFALGDFTREKLTAMSAFARVDHAARPHAYW